MRAPVRAPSFGALAAAAATFLLALPVTFSAGTYLDELTYLGHTRRVLAGEVMYRDFFEFLAPLSTYLPVPLFWLVGPSIVAARLLVDVLLAIAGACLYRLARLQGLPPWAAALPGPLVVATVYLAAPGYSHHWVVQPFLWGAVLAASLAMERDRAPWWLGCGVLVGLAGLVLQSDGTALVAALVAWLALDVLVGGRAVARAATRLTWVLAGAALPLLGVALYFAAHGAFGAAIYDTWLWTLSHYKQAGRINDVKLLTDLSPLLATTLPGFKLWKWYGHAVLVLGTMLLPLAMAGVLLARAAGLAGTWWRGERWGLATARLAFLALVLLALEGVLVRGKADFTHDLYALPASLLVATVLAWRWRALLPGPELAAARALPLAALLAFGAVGLAVNGDDYASDPERRLAWDGPEGRVAREPVIAYLRAHARVGDRLVVFPLGSLYYFRALPPATRFTHMLDPAEGYYDRNDFGAFWGEAAVARPRFLVYWPVAPGAPVPVPPLPGYKLVYAPDVPYLGAACHAYVYERSSRS